MSKAEDRYLEHFQDGRLRNCSSKEGCSRYDNKSGYRFNSLYNEMKNLTTKLIDELFI